MFQLTIKLGNDAMQSSYDIAEALTIVTRNLIRGDDSGIIIDNNGNRVGNWVIN